MVMILAAVETFKRECLGYLYGQRLTGKRDYYSISFALPIQLATNRKNSGVEQSLGSLTRLMDLMGSSKIVFPLIGDFHSHPSWDKHHRLPELSVPDIEDMKTHKRLLSIIIGISPRKRSTYLWQRQKNGGLFGSIGKYNIHINVSRLIQNNDGEQIEQILRLRADSAVRALNRMFGPAN
jgi:proteasome lid subunit RPN8/RPN11